MLISVCTYTRCLGWGESDSDLRDLQYSKRDILLIITLQDGSADGGDHVIWMAGRETIRAERHLAQSAAHGVIPSKVSICVYW
jgi:hypothetical protein